MEFEFEVDLRIDYEVGQGDCTPRVPRPNTFWNRLRHTAKVVAVAVIDPPPALFLALPVGYLLAVHAVILVRRVRG